MDENYINSISVKKIYFPDKHITGDMTFKMCCVGYVLRGSGCFLYSGASHIADAGDLIYIPLGTKYYSVWSGDGVGGSGEIEFYSISFSFVSPYAYSDYGFQIVKDFPREKFDAIHKANKESQHLCTMSLFYSLLDEIYPRLYSNSSQSKLSHILPAIDHINKHFMDYISVTMLAKLCYCSESAIYKMFSGSLGISPIRYKHNLMIQHALHLLLNTNMSIEEISLESGFSSSNYFRRVFHSITGSTPNDLRKRNSRE